MNLNDVISQLGSLRDNSADSLKADPENDLWRADVAACDTAIKALAALVAEGFTDLDAVLDLLTDYRSLAKQYQTMRRKYEAPAKPTHKDGVWHCPGCNGRVQINHTHCHRCGQKLGWSR